MTAAGDLDVVALDATVYTVPLETPEADGTLQWDHTSYLVVEPRLRNGLTGLGYAVGSPACRAVVDEVLQGAVRDRDVRDVGACWSAMVRAIRNLGRPGICSMAIAAVDIALWDTAARVHGVPLHRLLGATRDRVPVYGSGGFTSLAVDELCAQLRGWVDEGIPRVKMKVGKDWGRSWREDLERVRAARAAVGDDVDLYVDANGGYDLVRAREMGTRYCEESNVSWFEEPVSSDDRDGLAHLRGAWPADVAAGEYGYDLAYFSTMLSDGAVDVLQADVGRCGGITEWLRAAAAAAAYAIPFSGHCQPSIHAHVATVPPNLRHLEYFHDHVRADRLLFDGVLAPVGGCLVPAADRPGLGLELRRSDADRYRVA